MHRQSIYLFVRVMALCVSERYDENNDENGGNLNILAAADNGYLSKAEFFLQIV